jgi:hypothetical protein
MRVEYNGILSVVVIVCGAAIVEAAREGGGGATRCYLPEDDNHLEILVLLTDAD